MSASTSLAFLDTNILVYAFEPIVSSKRERAQSLVNQALDAEDAVISFQVVQEFLNVALRKFPQPMGRSEAQFYLAHVLMPLCEVYPSPELYYETLSIAEETGWSFYDSLIVSSALAAGCGVILTEDLQHGRRIRGAEIRNPFL